MIVERIGNLVEQVTHGIIVQQVNAQGVMGSGIAKEIRQKWPVVYDAYSCRVKPNQLDKGRSYLGLTIPIEVVENEIYVYNIVAQQFYGRNPPAGSQPDFTFTDYESLEKGLKEVGECAKEVCWPVHLPLIGCGLARGDWRIVRNIIERQLDGCDVTIWRLKTD